MDGTSTDTTPTVPTETSPVGRLQVLPELSQEDRQRRARIAAAWQAYRGEWGGGPLIVAPGDPDDNVRPNRCMPIVDTGVAFLFGELLRIEISNDTDAVSGAVLDVDNGAEAGASPAQAYLDACWGDEDDRMTLLGELAMNGAVGGSAFAMLAPADAEMGEELPQIIVLDSANVSVITDPHDCRRVRAYWIQYESTAAPDVNPGVDGGRAGQRVTYRKVVARAADGGWTIDDYERVGGDTTWRCIAHTDWPYTWSPIEDCQNLIAPNEHWGLPDLPPDLIQMNRALIFTESNTNRVIKHFAHPTRWAKGVTAAQVNTTPDNILLFQSEHAELNALDAKADLANMMGYAETLRADMDEQSQVPSVALGRMKELPRGQLSGVTIRALYAPLMAKTTKKRRLYGRLIRRLSQHLLELGGYMAASRANILLHWQDPMPNDDVAEAQTALAWQQIGVSQDTLMQRAGFDPDVESAKSETEAQRKMELQNQGMLTLGAGGMMPPIATSRAATQPPSAPAGDGSDGAASPSANIPPVNHPKAIAARQAAQLAAGKPVTPDGKKPGAK